MVKRYLKKKLPLDDTNIYLEQNFGPTLCPNIWDTLYIY